MWKRNRCGSSHEMRESVDDGNGGDYYSFFVIFITLT